VWYFVLGDVIPFCCCGVFRLCSLTSSTANASHFAVQFLVEFCLSCWCHGLYCATCTRRTISLLCHVYTEDPQFTVPRVHGGPSGYCATCTRRTIRLLCYVYTEDPQFTVPRVHGGPSGYCATCTRRTLSLLCHVYTEDHQFTLLRVHGGPSVYISLTQFTEY